MGFAVSKGTVTILKGTKTFYNSKDFFNAYFSSSQRQSLNSDIITLDLRDYDGEMPQL